MIVDTFGNNLYFMRIKAGISQHDLAVRAGLERNTVIKYEQGKGNPTLRSIEGLAAVLGVTVSDLITERR